MIEQLTKHYNLISEMSKQRQRPVVCVEAGHIYTDEVPALKHEVGAIVGSKISKLLEGMGVQVQRMLFVDDYNVEHNSLDLDAYQSMLSKHGFTPDRLIMESLLLGDAEDVISALEQKSLTEKNKKGAVILKKNCKKENDIVLRKSPERGALPACAAIDTALYLKKHETAGICVTVLPVEWRGQQDGVRKVLYALGKDLPILEVYYSDDGEIEIEFDY